jgi:hypothetical protein
MPQHTPSVLEIDRKLRDDFRRRVKDFGVDASVTDPFLAVLFRTVAQQIDQVYGDTNTLRQSLLHELMAGLQVQQYLARPAQTVVRLLTDTAESKVLRAGTELNALASSGERLSFGLDATFEVSQARIAFALSYQDQALRLLTGVEMSDLVQALRPSADPVPVALGPQPALYLAIENLPPALLSRHGIFFELGPGTYAVQNALCHEPWWFFGPAGELSGSGLMRPRCVNGGVYRLDWQCRTIPDPGEHDALAEIPEGFYSGRQFHFPVMQPGEEHLCRVPRLLEPALARICGRDVETLLQLPRIWIKVPMPPGIPMLHHAVNNILLHTMTASNIFCRNQSIRFERDGVSIPVTREGGMPEFLVAPLSVTSVENDPYEMGSRPQRSSISGWYEVHNNRLTVHAGHNRDGSRHQAANVRLWLTNGELGNRVGPGDITGFANAATLHHIRLAPFSAAAGGSNGEDYASEERRFSAALLTRGRIVTRRDLEEAALALDRRILSANTRSAVERRDHGLRRVEHLLLTLDSHAFTQPESELPLLRSQIELSLRSKLVEGLILEVSFQWS